MLEITKEETCWHGKTAVTKRVPHERGGNVCHASLGVVNLHIFQGV